MKKFLIRLLSFLLIVTMLLPLAVACKKDPPPNDDDDDNTQSGDPEPSSPKTVSVKLASTEEKTLINPETADIRSKYVTVDDSLGQKTLKWEAVRGTTTILSTETVKSFVDYYYLEFSVYCPQVTKETIKIQPLGAKHSQPVVLDFQGWMKFKIRTEEFQAYFPCPDVTGIYLIYDGSEPLTVYVSEIKLTKPKYELVVPEGININDPSIYNEIVAKYRNRLVGDLCVSDTPEYQAKVNSIEGGKNKYWKLFKDTYTDDAAAGVVFGIPMDGVDPTGLDKDPITGKVKKLGTNIKLYYEYLREMAEGYACVKGQNYHDPELLSDILKGLEYGYKYYYGEEIIAGINYGDWFPWQISIPGEIVTILVCIQPSISQEQINKYLTPFVTLMTHPRGAASNMLNVAKYLIGAGALLKDAYIIAETLELIQNEYQYVDLLELEAREIRDGGFYSDGSFVQHTGIAYTYAYGSGMLSSLGEIGFITVGTAFERQNEVTEHQYEIIFNAFLPTTFDVNGTFSLHGRCIDNHTMERNTYLGVFVAAMLIRSYAPERWKAKYDSLVKYMINQLDEKFHEPWENRVPIYALDCIALANDSTVTPLTQPEQTVVYKYMDRVTQHTGKYGVALSLSSTRIYKYESINANNELGWYHGDGMLYIYTDGYDYGFHHFGYANPYLMAGTTVNLAPRKEQCIYPAYYNTNPFAGGVSQGKYGASGFILGYPEDAPAFNNANDTKISAKKSYFFFDNEIVCLGSDIKDESGYNVITTVENKLWKLRWTNVSWDTNEKALYDGDERVTPTVQTNGLTDTCTVPDISMMTELQSRTMWFEKTGGYVFLGNDEVYYRVIKNYANAKGTEYKGSDSGSMEFLEIVINHGIGNSSLDGKYAYLYLPEATLDETNAYNANPDVEILLRSDTTHAVLEKKLGIVGCVFFEDFSDAVELDSESTAVSYIESETPCAVMISKNADGSYTVSVSDPTQSYSNIKLSVSIDGISEITNADGNVNGSISGGTLNINVKNAKDNAGGTFSITVK